MSVMIKCKMCGGDLHITEGSTVCECEYCGTKQTVPTLDNEKKITLFSRAGRLLRNCEFDKASGIFETIVADFPEEAEAYWGLVLCKYGIEYVDDTATGKKIPTCHRSSFESVLEDSNFEQACENTDAVARRVYREEARQLEELRKSIIEVSGKEEPYDIFISYKETDENGNRTLDSVIAQDIYTELTEKGYRVFFSRISLEDKLGVEYEPYIFAALNSAKVMLVVGTDYKNFDAIWVKNEWSRFMKLIVGGQKKVLIPVFKNMDPYDMPKEFSKLAAQDMGKVGAMQDLLRGVEKILERKQPQPSEPQKVFVQSGGPNITAMLKRGQQALEDKEWQKADEFFDQVLNMDAECAEAFIGKFCVREHAESFDAALKKRLDAVENKAVTEPNLLTDEDYRFKKIISDSIIKGYYTEEQLVRKLPKFDYRYDSRVSSIKKITQEEVWTLKREKNIARAMKYAEGTTATTLNNFLHEFEKQLQDKVKQAEAEEKTAKEKKEKEYDAYLAKIQKVVTAVKEKASVQRENDYLSYCKQMDAVNTEVEYHNCISNFMKLEGYKDSADKIAQCNQYINTIQEEKRAEAARRKAAALAEAKRQRAEKERIRIEKEELKKAAERARKKKETILLSIAAAVAVVGLAIFLFFFHRSEVLSSQYSKAIMSMAEGKYEEAIIIFETLGDFKDSEAQIVKCEIANKEIKYQNAIALMEAENYQAAEVEFKALGDYKDSKDQVLLCITEIEKEEQYQTALTLKDAGKYAEAVSAFEALNGYKNSVAHIETCQSAVKEEKYRQAKEKSLKEARVGRFITFGRYEQDNITENDKEGIEWLVLERESNKVLLISKYALDCQQYHSSRVNTSWETCSLRSWLNSTFLNTAFSSDEQRQLLTTTVMADQNPSYSTASGNNTSDKIFLLSITEVNQYFPLDYKRDCKPTQYAVAQECYVDKGNGNCWWWLRSPGREQNRAAIVYTNGSVFEVGYSVSFNKSAVRPAMWISLNP